MKPSESTSTKIPISHLATFGGMNRSVPAHLIKPDEWWTQFGMRRKQGGGLVQVPRKCYSSLNTNESYPITNITAVPYSWPNKSNIFAFGRKVWFCNSTSLGAALCIRGPDGLIVPGIFNLPDPYGRWATTVFEGRLYFTNKVCPIHVVTDQQEINRLNYVNVNPKAYDQPAGCYLETFFDHLVVANCSYRGYFPWRVHWSDVRKFHVFESSNENEADYYDILEDTPSLLGITGMAKFGDALIVYTGSSIWAATYVGLPTGMRWSRRISGIGNDFPWAVVPVDKFHFFISERWRTIGLFDGSEIPQPIGDPIAKYFFDDLTTNPNYRYRLWGTLDNTNREVVWTYISTVSLGGVFDRQLVYNLQDKTWYIRGCEDVQSFMDSSYVYTNIDSLAGTTINEWAGTTIQGLSPGAVKYRMWGMSNGRFAIDSNDPHTNLLDCAQPYLETGDFTYGDIWAVKEVERLFILAKDLNYVRVSVSVRNSPDDTISWTTYTNWTTALKADILATPRMAGRIFRFKFEPLNNGPDPEYSTAVDWNFNGFIDYVYGAQSVEK